MVFGKPCEELIFELTNTYLNLRIQDKLSLPLKAFVILLAMLIKIYFNFLLHCFFEDRKQSSIVSLSNTFRVYLQKCLSSPQFPWYLEE